MHQGRMAGSTWDPARYGIFSDHRLRPALELLGRVPLSDPRLIYDLGCGPGEITRIIAHRWPDAEVIGVDNSPQMLATASARSDEIAWIEADVAGWKPAAAPDLIYSNATLQWLDDHDALIPRLFGLLAPGGCLAVQMPQSWPLPSHRLMRETLAQGGAGGAPIGPVELRRALDHVWVAEASHYFDLLSPSSQSLDIWETEYLQMLEGENPVLDWVSGTGLRPVLNGLDGEDRDRFLQRYTASLLDAYPRRPNGQTLYPFRRLFIVAVKG
ncbi:MAG TPA: methyltransferase domain-containing protein [Thermomicrobiales bacterium]|nr:methyltransferase domain-containing protein [Thermomicrobiales bacterium]